MEWKFGFAIVIFACLILYLTNLHARVWWLKIATVFGLILVPILYVFFGIMIEVTHSVDHALMEIQNNKVVSIQNHYLWGWNCDGAEYPTNVRNLPLSASWQADGFSHQWSCRILYQNIETIEGLQTYYDTMVKPGLMEHRVLPTFGTLDGEVFRQIQAHISDSASTTQQGALMYVIFNQLNPAFNKFGLQVVGVRFNNLTITEINNPLPAEKPE